MKKSTTTLAAGIILLLSALTGCNPGEARRLPLKITISNTCFTFSPPAVDSVTVCVRFFDSAGKDIFGFSACRKIKVSDTARFETETKFHDGDQWKLESVEGINCHYMCSDTVSHCLPLPPDTTLVPIDSTMKITAGCSCR